MVGWMRPRGLHLQAACCHPQDGMVACISMPLFPSRQVRRRCGVWALQTWKQSPQCSAFEAQHRQTILLQPLVALCRHLAIQVVLRGGKHAICWLPSLACLYCRLCCTGEDCPQKHV